MTDPIVTHRAMPCPHCRHDLRVRYEYLGELMRCRYCEQQFRAKVEVVCPGCGRFLRARPQAFGQHIVCGFCQGAFTLRVPANCPQCGRALYLRPEHLGRRCRCRSCSHSFRLGPDRHLYSGLKPYQAAALLADLNGKLAALLPVETSDAAAITVVTRAPLFANPLGDHETFLQRLARDLERVTAERDILSTRYRRGLQESEALRARAADLERLLAEARQQAGAATAAGERGEWEARLADLAGQRDRLHEAVARLRAEADGLRRGLVQAEARGCDLLAHVSRLREDGACRERELGTAHQGLAAAKQSCAALAARVEGLAAELEAQREQTAAVAGELVAARQECESQRGLGGRLWLLLEKERQAAGQSRQGLAARIAALEAELKAQGERAAALEQEWTAARAQHDRELAARRDLECQVAEREARRAELQSRYEALLAEESVRASQRATLMEEAATLQANLDRLTSTLTALATERDQLAAERDVLAGRAAEAEAERLAWQARAAEVAGERDRLVEAAGRLRVDSRRLRRRLARTRARAHAGVVQRRILEAQAAAEVERLGHDLGEARRGLGDAERARGELVERVAQLEGALQAERGRVEELSATALAARRDAEERRGLAGRLWLALEKEQLAGERARAALERSRAQSAVLEEELAEARQALTASTAERDALRERLAEVEARLQGLQEESVAEQARREATFQELTRDHEALMHTQEELTRRAEALLSELAQAQQAAVEAEAALHECRRDLAAALEDGQEQRRRADDLERELTAERAEAARGAQEGCTLAAAQALEQEKRSLEVEVARLRAAQGGEPLGPETSGKATFWERVGSGALPLDPAWLRLPELPAPVARSAAREQTVGAGSVTPEQMLRGIGQRPPDRGTIEAALQRLGQGGFATILATAAKGDSAVRRGAGRLCSWVAEKARELGSPQRARDASEQALWLFSQLAAEPFADHTVRAELVLSQLTHARCERRAGRGRESFDLLLTAREAARALVAEQPHVAAYRRLLARSLHDLGVVLFRAGRSAQAEGCLRAAVRHQTELVRQAPQARNHAVELEQMKIALERCLSGQPPPRSTLTEPIPS
ncbi:MAG: hypothetical protein L0Z62_03095 [Gemmataceae bacterium]|nr:hypothetical protein [Gemmataceae bacterium]